MMQNMMNKNYGAGVLLAGLLTGCATQPGQQETPQQASGARTVPHLINTDVSRNILPAAPAAPADLKKDPAKPAGKDELHLGTGVFVKLPGGSGTGAAPASGDEVMLNFEGADLREVVKAFVVDFLGETYIMDAKVQGVVSLHTTRPIARKALLPTLETVLRMNGAAIVKEEGLYKVIPAASAARGSLTPQLGASSAALPSGYSVQIVPLKFIATREMIKILEPFVTDASAVRIDEVRNLMILSGTERELRHLIETIDMFDIDWLAGMSVGLFTLQSVDAKTAVADLDKVFGAAAQNPLSGIVKFVPIERLNAILVVTGTSQNLDRTHGPCRRRRRRHPLIRVPGAKRPGRKNGELAQRRLWQSQDHQGDARGHAGAGLDTDNRRLDPGNAAPGAGRGQCTARVWRRRQCGRQRRSAGDCRQR